MKSFLLNAGKLLLVWVAGAVVLFLFMVCVALISKYGASIVFLWITGVLSVILCPLIIGLVIIGDKVFPRLKGNFPNENV